MMCGNPMPAEVTARPLCRTFFIQLSLLLANPYVELSILRPRQQLRMLTTSISN